MIIIYIESFSALQRAEIAEIARSAPRALRRDRVSVLFNEPKLLKLPLAEGILRGLTEVSVLFNEPKLLKCCCSPRTCARRAGFSALQRAEIAEIRNSDRYYDLADFVSVLFNEPKLLKCISTVLLLVLLVRFSALQRAEIAEIGATQRRVGRAGEFQCSSTSRNC